MLQLQIKETKNGDNSDEFTHLRKAYNHLVISRSLPIRLSKATGASVKAISEAEAHKKATVG